MSCVFCEIIARRAPGLILYEDDTVISFLSNRPYVWGHTLIVPKAHHADFYDTPADVLAKLAAACQTHALHYRATARATGVNLLHASGADAQQSVFHFHFHLLPRFADDGVDAWPHFSRPAASREEMHAALRFA